MPELVLSLTNLMVLCLLMLAEALGLEPVEIPAVSVASPGKCQAMRVLLSHT